MDAWGDIRLKARECHHKALVESNNDRSATALLAAALKLEDLELHRYEPGTKAGPEVYGFLERSNLLVNVAKGQPPDEEAVVIAHELGHFHLHRDPRNEVTTKASGLGGDPIESGAGRVSGYSPRERKEVQADIFAGEFLCPADWLRSEYMDHGKKPSQIAKELGVPHSLVLNQMIRALLLPPLRSKPPIAPQPRVALDPSQEEAALWDKGPLLVDAGPGTGKTRTLVHRVEHLLGQGRSPVSILALTFSRKAAEEMRERIAATNPEAAIEMWAGTFHAFGMELVTKWAGKLRRTEKVKILDDAGTLALLENNLDQLPLKHFQNLYEPAFELVPVLRAISRCKDEMIAPETLKTEAEAALRNAASEDDREAAEKALEVAAVYEIYERLLEADDALDFGDLVMKAAILLEDNPDVARTCHDGFQHLLVDEYQDVNYASSRLLRALTKPGSDCWVVADPRQSIYRFRGAAPGKVARFIADFGAERRALGVNYRSGAPVVRTFQSFGSQMQVAVPGSGWTPHRGQVGGASVVVAPTLADEAAAIRANIDKMLSEGIPYSDQAILARSHGTLALVADALENLGVPLLYLGDLFERHEIRDLLSLVAIDAEPGGLGLVRVAQLKDYEATKADALAVIAWAEAHKVSIFEALLHLGEIKDLTQAGRKGLSLLASELQGLGPTTSTWVLLTTWLFERSRYISNLLIANDAKSQQKLIAIYQLLKVCGEQVPSGGANRKRFLDRIRRIEALNDERMYRAVSSEAADMDAVRVMTVHGSKGLEFRAVHLPRIATRYMPATRQGIRCPMPRSLPQLTIAPGDHEAEEECLFFVALSRARDYLFISRAERYTSTNSTASKFLPMLGPVPSSRQAGGNAGLRPASTLQPPPPRTSYNERELSLYNQCPASYRYEFIDGLRGGRDSSAYIQFHRCVYRTIGWLEAERAGGRTPDIAAARAQLDQDWAARGPKHGFEPYYRKSADAMVASMAAVIASETGEYDRDEWSVELGGHHVTLTPDRVIVKPDGSVLVQRIRTGKRTKSEQDKAIYALLRLGARQRYPGRTARVETFYLAASESVIATAKNDDKLLDEYRDAIAGIESGAFDAKPNPRVCPNCQSYLICGA